MSMYFNWEAIRSQQLLEERGISFEDVVFYIQKGGLRDFLRFRNRQRESQQAVLVVEIHNYVYLVPCIETGESWFLQTITPSQKAKSSYLEVSE